MQRSQRLALRFRCSACARPNAGSIAARPKPGRTPPTTLDLGTLMIKKLLGAVLALFAVVAFAATDANKIGRAHV